MEKGFHPVSGEEIYIASKLEKQIIDVALEHYMATAFNTSHKSGVING